MRTDIGSLDGATVHHVAVVVPNIMQYLTRSPWCDAGPVVHDPLQRARLCIIELGPGGGPAIELVEPEGKESPTWTALQKGTTWHHICLRVPSAQHADELIQRHRLLPVTHWKPAVLFDGRPIRFAYTRNRELIEFLSEERGDEHDIAR